jgi:hypothetical protein
MFVPGEYTGPLIENGLIQTHGWRVMNSEFEVMESPEGRFGPERQQSR